MELAKTHKKSVVENGLFPWALWHTLPRRIPKQHTVDLVYPPRPTSLEYRV